MKSGTVIVYDNGLFPYIASALVGSFGRVLYFSTWHEAFPSVRKCQTGFGLPGVERLDHFFDEVDNADLIVFPDVGHADVQMYLREQGSRVWGSAAAAALELDRAGLVELMRAKKMDGAKDAEIVDGIDALEVMLREVDDRYVKMGLYRGDWETYHHRNWWLTEPKFLTLRQQLGPVGNAVQFVVEKPIEGVEVGYDGYCVDGEFPPVTMYGFEQKDAAYLGRVVRNAELPGVLRTVNSQLSGPLGELGCRSMFSTEVRVRRDGTGVLIDPTLRTGSPPGGAMVKAFGNWGDVMLGGSEGLMVPLQPKARYAAEVMLKSAFAEKEFLPLRFPEEHREWLMLHGHFIRDGVDYVSMGGLDIDIIGAAVGIGDTAEDAKANAIEVAKSVEGVEVTYDADAFDKIDEQIEQGITSGINWS